MKHAPRDVGSGRDGLTLIEVVVAAGVLSVILLGTFSAVSAAQRSDVLTRERAAASEACFAMLDAVLTGPVPAAGEALAITFPASYDTGRGSVDLRPADPFPSEPWTFIGESPPATVTQAGIAVARVGVDGAANEDLMEVRVLVAWRAADGTNQRVEAVSRRLR